MKTQSTIYQKVKADIKTAQKNGLFKGKVSLQTKKLDAPLWIESQQFNFYHNYENHTVFTENLFKNDCEVFMKFVNGIFFKVVFGNPHKSHELRCVFQNIFEENYKVCGSSIQIDGTKIILNLSLKMPKQNIELDEDTVVGVDLGIAVPSVCALNNNQYAREFIGSKDDFLRVRTQIANQRKNLQRSLKNSNGGHGRKKKMKPMDRFEKYESHFVQSYNHMVSKRIIDFALKHRAKYINIECLRGYDTSKFILRNWSYYQLQQYITYKAEKYGIVVRKINPCYTSQVCSFCGKHHPDNRPKGDKGQAYFKCQHCGTEVNADFNAARNIAMSTLWFDDEMSEKYKEEARNYYGINDVG
jgi:IS605 OrfB family transposase